MLRLISNSCKDNKNWKTLAGDSNVLRYVFIVEVHLAIQVSLQALHVNPKSVLEGKSNRWVENPGN